MPVSRLYRMIILLLAVLLSSCGGMLAVDFPTPTPVITPNPAAPLPAVEPSAALEADPIESSSTPSIFGPAGHLYVLLQNPNNPYAPRFVIFPSDCIKTTMACPPPQDVPGLKDYVISYSMQSQLIWTSDGHYAAMVTADPNTQQSTLGVYDPQSETWNPLVVHPGLSPDIAWSPDGQWLIYTRSDDGVVDLYKVRRDGSDNQNWTNGSLGDVYVKNPGGWMGDTYYFTAGKDGVNFLYRIKIDETQATRVSNEPIFRGTALGWLYLVPSPDGQHMAYFDVLPGRGNVVSLMDSTGAFEREVFSSTDESVAGYTWTSDSQWLVLTLTKEGQGAQVALVRPDGSELHMIYEGQRFGRVLAVPDSNLLLVEEQIQGGGLHLVILSTETFEARPLTVDGVGDEWSWTNSSWRP